MDTLFKVLSEHPSLGYAGAGLASLLYLSALADEKLWCKFEVLLGISYVLSLPFTGHLLRIWLDGKDGDDAAKFVFSLILLGMTCLAYQIHWTKYTQDPVVTASLHITCILSRVGLLFAAVKAMLFSSGFSRDALMADCIFMSMLIAGNMCHLKKVSTKDGGLRMTGYVRKYVVSDAVLCFLIGLVLVGFSDMVDDIFVNKNSAIHTMLIKSFGFQVLAFSVQSFASLCYKDDREIVTIYLPRLWMLLPIAICIAWNSTISSSVTTCDCILLCTSVVFLLQNLLICFHTPSTTKQD